MSHSNGLRLLVGTSSLKPVVVFCGGLPPSCVWLWQRVQEGRGEKGRESGYGCFWGLSL